MMDRCPCGSGLPAEALIDGHGIFMTHACAHCRHEKIARFRPDIFEQYETDDNIEQDNTP